MATSLGSCAGTQATATASLKDVYFHGDNRGNQDSDDPLLVALARWNKVRDPLSVKGDTGVLWFDRSLVDGNGRIYTFNAPNSFETVSANLPAGSYRLRVLADCQTPVEMAVTISGSQELDFQYSKPQQARAYLARNVSASSLNNAGAVNLQVNTVVETLRPWPTVDDLAERAERARKELENLQPAPGATIDERMQPLYLARQALILRPEQCHGVAVRRVDGRAGDVYVLPAVALSQTQLSDDAVTKVVQEDHDAAERKAEPERARLAAIDRDSDAEVAAGSCSTPRKEELPRILGTVRQVLEQSLGFVVLDHVTTLATPKGTKLPFTFATAGEFHLFAFSYSPLTFKGGVQDSPFGPSFEGMTGARVSSTIVQASPSSPPALTLTGKGCTLVVQAKKL